MDDSSLVNSPMQTSYKLTKHGSPALTDPHMYRSVVGALQYVTIAMFEISYSVNKVCHFMLHPLETHWAAIKRILRYLKGTIQYDMYLSPHSPLQPPSLQAFCETD